MTGPAVTSGGGQPLQDIPCSEMDATQGDGGWFLSQVDGPVLTGILREDNSRRGPAASDISCATPTLHVRP